MTSNPPTPVEAATLLIKGKATRDLLEMLATSKDAKECWRKTLLLTFILWPEIVGNQRDLARKLGVHESRVSQMLRVFRSSNSSRPN